MIIKKVTEDYDEVQSKDILSPGDWILKWNPNSPEDQTGFSLYVPKGFDPGNGGGPLGGLMLAAVYFLIENGDSNFSRTIINKANELSKEIEAENEQENQKSGSVFSSSGRILN